MSYRFVQDDWIYYAPDWEQVRILVSIRSGTLEKLLRANRAWLKPLAKLSKRRYKYWSSIFQHEEETKRLSLLDKNQPEVPDLQDYCHRQ